MPSPHKTAPGRDDRPAKAPAKATAQSSDQRRHRRAHVLFSGSLTSGGRKCAALVLNLSAGGAMLQLSDRLDAAAKVTLRLARAVDFPGTVVWRRDGRIGLSFADAPARTAAILAGLLPAEPSPA